MRQPKESAIKPKSGHRFSGTLMRQRKESAHQTEKWRPLFGQI
jgi:hypothetical protein